MALNIINDAGDGGCGTMSCESVAEPSGVGEDVPAGEGVSTVVDGTDKLVNNCLI